MYSLSPSSISISIYLTNNTGILTGFDGNIVDIIGDKFIANINISIVRRQKWNIILTLRYTCLTLIDNSSIKLFCKFISLNNLSLLFCQ